MQVLATSELQEKIRDVVARLRSALSPVAIYLFGSYVYGTPGPDSDLDLLVVVEDSPLDAYKRDALAYRALRGVDMPIDVQVYTRREFEPRAELPVSFERMVRGKGRLVYAA